MAHADVAHAADIMSEAFRPDRPTVRQVRPPPQRLMWPRRRVSSCPGRHCKAARLGQQWQGVRMPLHHEQAITYSSRLEGFATQHWSQSSHKAVREEDVEAAAEEPLLGHDDPEYASLAYLCMKCRFKCTGALMWEHACAER
jgi:hypothetical protein